MADFMLSLVSNPYDPFTEYKKWKRFDTQEGFDTDGLLARLASTSDALSEPDQDTLIEDAIDSVVDNPSFRGLYEKRARVEGS